MNEKDAQVLIEALMKESRLKEKELKIPLKKSVWHRAYKAGIEYAIKLIESCVIKET